MNKADKDKVIAALESGRIMGYDYAIQSYSREVTPKIITEALSIMRGLADAEPVARVAEVHMSRYTLEWLNGPLPEGTELYTSPQAAQTALKSESSAQAAQAPARLPSEGKTIEALAPIQAAQTDERNGCLSNCRNCQHFRRDTGGHCYMFKDEPQGVCAKWIASNTLAFGFPSNWAGRKG